MKLRSRTILAAVTALGLLTVNGCGELPTAPRSPDPGAVAAGPAASGGLVASDGGIDVTQPVQDPLPAQPVLGPELETSAGLVGEVGGSVQLKDVAIVVPPDAFQGAAQIAVTIPDSAKLEVHLEITPASKNHFDVPVRLVFDAKAAGKDPRMMVIRWRNPADNSWVDIPTTMDPVSGKVWADLAHFSEYECVSEVQGRAGW